MPTEQNNSVNILLDAAGGRCNTRSMTCQGGHVPTMPIPERNGYDFDGWYTKVTGGDKIDTGMSVDFDSEICLYAHWSQNKAENQLREQKKKRNIRKKQQKAIIIMAIAVVLLAIALIVINHIVDIYKYEDVDGSVYYIKKKDDVYALYDSDSIICDFTQDGYYQTKIGTQLKINPETGEITDTIYVDDLNSLHSDESFGYSGRVLMFKQLTYDASSTNDKSKIIESIAVSNMNGGFTFKRGENNTFFVEGNQHLFFNTEKFAQFAVACGKTLTVDVLKNPALTSDGKIDLSEYGLTDEDRTKTEVDKDGNEQTVDYKYSPAVYTISTMSGEWHRVIVGDAIISDAGYYAIYDGGYVKDADGNFKEVGRRDRVYILGSSGIVDGVLARIEDLITPMIVYPMGENEYFDVKDFTLYNNIKHDEIEKALIEAFGDRFDNMTSEEIANAVDKDENISKVYYEIFEKNTGKICHFTYQDLSERQNSMNAYLPYVSHIEYTKGYYINSDNISAMLFNLQSMQFVEVTKLNPTYDDLEEYGLNDYEYYLTYYFHNAAADTETEKSYILNTVNISKKNEKGHYYAYSDMYDMIVCIDESYLNFIEWEEYKWYDQRYIQLDISNIQNIIIESPSLSVDLKFDNSASSIGSAFPQSGREFTDSLGTKYKVDVNENNKFVLKKDGNEVKCVYSGDYMTGGISYAMGQREQDNYIFAESQQQDVNGDEYIDFVIYYAYDIIRSDKNKYELAAQVVTTNAAGETIGQPQTIIGNAAMECQYFTTTSGFLFFASKSSALGQVLDTRYAKYNLGKWHMGGVYMTADKEMVLIDASTGEWAKIDSVTNPIFCGDAENSSLIKGAIRTENTYDASGNIKMPGDVYYPTAGYELRYNADSGKIEKYTVKTGVWSNATTEDCSVGVWAKGAYYITESRDAILVNEGSGEFSIMTLTTSSSKGAQVYADGEKLDYEINTTLSTGKTTIKNEVDNFREFYKGLIYANLEGMADLTDEQMQAFMQMDDFTNTDKNNPCKLKITVLGKDLYGNERYIVYRFYRYSERKAYITVEVLDSADTSKSDSTKAYGSFYVLSSFADKIISDAEKLLSGTEITATSKY